MALVAPNDPLIHVLMHSDTFSHSIIPTAFQYITKQTFFSLPTRSFTGHLRRWVWCIRALVRYEISAQDFDLLSVETLLSYKKTSSTVNRVSLVAIEQSFTIASHLPSSVLVVFSCYCFLYTSYLYPNKLPILIFVSHNVGYISQLDGPGRFLGKFNIYYFFFFFFSLLFFPPPH